MLDTVIVLISNPRTQDENGVWRKGSPIRREVFAQADSVNRAEFFAAGQTGLHAEWKFVVFAAEYQAEAECEYSGERYVIYRTYHVPATDYLELYAAKKVGIHGEDHTD